MTGLILDFLISACGGACVGRAYLIGPKVLYVTGAFLIVVGYMVGVNL